MTRVSQSVSPSVIRQRKKKISKKSKKLPPFKTEAYSETISVISCEITKMDFSP